MAAHEKNMVRAAKIRAALLPYITNLTQPESISAIYQHFSADLEELGTNEAAVTKLIEGMADNGQIGKVKRGRLALYWRKVYEVAESSSGQNMADKPAAAPTPLPRKRQTLDLIESMTIAGARILYLQLF